MTSLNKSNMIIGNSSRAVYGFPGGVHPPERKTDSNTTPIRQAVLPSQVVLPLSQHAGAPAEPVVSVGERVLKGQLVAKAKGLVSANIHASISGVVTAIETRPVQHASGLDQPCIVINSDGRDEWIAHEGIADWQALEPAALIARIRETGIAGMGGAGFPSAVKLAPRKPITQLILNAVECEPYITADDVLMRERAADIVEGLKILRHILNADEVLVGIEDNKPEAIAAMRKAATGCAIDVVVVPTKYPSGGEKQLIQNLTGKEVPSGSLPADVGVVCTNTGTAHAVYRAIALGEPLISRVTTLTGEALARRGNVEARIGTPVIDLLREAGLDTKQLHRLVMGGPMMGFTLHTSAVPIVKTTNCLIAATAVELPDPAPEQACIRCGACAEACPASLLPQQLYWFSKAGEFAKAQDHHVMDCIECGACSYVCPSSIPLVQYFRYAKGEIRKKQAEEKKAERAKLRFEARQARNDREMAEREAKRKARAEAAKLRAAAPDAATEHAAGVSAAPAVDLEKLKHEVGEASSAYKAAVRAAKEAEDAGAVNAVELRQHAESCKQRADDLKAQMRNAKIDAPTAPAASETSNTTDIPPEARSEAKTATGIPAASTTPVVESPAINADQMKQIKAAVATSTRQYKEAANALEVAERAGADNLADMQARVGSLKQKADEAKAALEAVVAQMKAASGKKEET